MSGKHPESAPGLAVVIPTLDAAATLAATLAALAEGAALLHEIVVADGGSDDATVALAGRAGARVVAARPGRGRQLAAGARPRAPIGCSFCTPIRSLAGAGLMRPRLL